MGSQRFIFEMSFYLTLTSEELLHGETSSYFTTVFEPPIILEGPFDVALVELCYPNAIELNIGSITLTAEENLICHEVIINDRLLIYDFINVLNNTFENQLRSTYQDQTRRLQLTGNNPPTDPPTEPYTITLDDKLSFFFKTKHREATRFIINMGPQINILKNYYIFCDLIEDQCFGRKKEKLLKMIKPQGQSMDNICIEFEKPHYVKVSKTFISTIQIKITDEFKKQLNFAQDSGPVILKLHFLKKNELLRDSSKRCLNGYLPYKRTNKLHNRPKNTSRSFGRKLSSRTR